MSRQRGASDAVAMANWSDRKWVWIPHQEEGYILSHILKTEQDTVLVQTSGEESETSISINDTQKVNPPKFDKVEDMADLAYLNEASVVHNLKLRYLSNLIYTYSGLFLVAVNPYQKLPIYTPKVVAQYRSKRRGEMPPHIFAIADNAYRDMLQGRENQSILITGESGAGKTENTKRVIQCLTSIASQAPLTRKSLRHVQMDTRSLDKQILQANPILEAFGNAQTIRNNNSSRFGKFIRLEFTTGGHIAGANIERYLLEKSRVTHQSPHERSFHIFYQFLSGADADIKSHLLISSDPSGYGYIKHSNKRIEGVDDAEEYQAVTEAMRIMGFEEGQITDFLRVIASILHIGNIKVSNDRGDSARFDDTTACERVCHVLGISASDFMRDLTKPRIKAGRDWVVQSRNASQVLFSLEALARSIYDRMFTSLVSYINAFLGAPTNASREAFIGVLDIAGFEIFGKNSFEQLCINYTNERLQQFFNHHMFILEQEEYRKEGIEWKFLNFGLDLQPTIDLIEKTNNPIGVLSCLDEECVMPKATDATFTEKLHQLCKGSSQYEPRKFAKEGFMVHHYAGAVEYSTEGWLDKNKDPLPENVARLLGTSSEPFIASLFADADEMDSPSLLDRSPAVVRMHTKRVKKGAFRTVAQRHKEQLLSLVSQLYSTSPHFVRCILPNDEKKPGKFRSPLVLDQLRCNGVLEGIRICRAGYPNRLFFGEFRQRYEILCPGIIPSGFMDSRKATQLLISNLALDTGQYKLGVSKVFFKAGTLAELEEVRDQKLSSLISAFQAACHGFLGRRAHNRRLMQLKSVRLIQRNARVYVRLREWPWWKLFSKVKPILNVARMDDELRKKDEALSALNKEKETAIQAQDELLQKQSLLLAEKKEVEDELKSERAAAADQEEMLRRSQERQVALEDEFRELAMDYEQLEAKFDEISAQKANIESELDAVKEQMSTESITMNKLTKERKVDEERRKMLEIEIQEETERYKALKVANKGLEDTISDYSQQLEKSQQRESELLGHQHRLESKLAELEEQLASTEASLKELTLRKTELMGDLAKATESQNEYAQAKGELESVLKKKSSELATALQHLESEQNEKEALEKHRRELMQRLQVLESDLSVERTEKAKVVKAKKRLEEEVEELKFLIENKNDEESRAGEMRRLREKELDDLKEQLNTVNAELSSTRSKFENALSSLQTQLEEEKRDSSTVLRAKESLEKQYEAERDELERLSEANKRLEKTKRALELELSSATSDKGDMEKKLMEFSKSKDSKETTILQMNTKLEEQETTIGRLEREKSAVVKNLDTTAKELTSESQRRKTQEAARKRLSDQLSALQAKLEEEETRRVEAVQNLRGKTHEFEKAREQLTLELDDREQALEDVRKRVEREMKNLNTKVSELEVELEGNQKAKSRLEAEVEDLQHEIEREHATARHAERSQKHLVAETSSLSSAIESERRARESAEATTRKLQSQIESLADQLDEMTRANSSLQRAKSEMEAELKNLIAEIGAGGRNVHDLEKTKRKLEGDIEQLQAQLEEGEGERRKLEEARRRVEDEYADYRSRAEADLGAKDTQMEETRRLLLKEVNSIGTQLDEEVATRNELVKAKKRLELEIEELATRGDTHAKSLSEYEKAKKKMEASLRDALARLERAERVGKNFEELAARHERKANGFQAHLEELETYVDTLEKQRKAQDKKLEELSQELQGQDGKSALSEAKRKLEKEIQHLQEELENERDARALAETKTREDSTEIGFLRMKIQEEYEEQLEKLEEGKRAMQAQNRLKEQELADARKNAEVLERRTRVLHEEVESWKQRLEKEISLKNEEAAEKRRLLSENKELSGRTTSSASKVQELTDYVKALKERNESAVSKIEVAELNKIKAEKSESQLRARLNEVEEMLQDVTSQKREVDGKLKNLELELNETRLRSEDNEAELSDVAMTRRRLQTDLEEAAARHSREVADLNNEIDSVRKRYVTQLKELSAEVEIERNSSLGLKETVKRLEDENEEVSQRLQEEMRSNDAWTKERVRMEARIRDLSEAFSDSMAAQDELQHQTSALLSQIRDLRSQVDDLETSKASLERVRRNLEGRLEEMNEYFAEANRAKVNATTSLQAMEEEYRVIKEQLDEALEESKEYGDQVRLKETALNDALNECSKQKDLVEESERARAQLDRQCRDLTSKLSDMEANARTDGSRSITRLQERLAELTAQLDKESRDREEAARSTRKYERTVRELQFQLTEREKQKKHQEEEIRKIEARNKTMKGRLESMEMNEADWLLAKRRLEREALEAVERASRYEKEVERLKGRMERNMSSLLLSPPASVSPPSIKHSLQAPSNGLQSPKTQRQSLTSSVPGPESPAPGPPPA